MARLPNLSYPWPILKSQGDWFLVDNYKSMAHLSSAAYRQAKSRGPGCIIKPIQVDAGIILFYAQEPYPTKLALHPHVEAEDELDDMDKALLAFEDDPDNPDNW